MIKKIATIMALALSVSMMGVVPASASVGCNDNGDELALEIAVEGSIGIDDNGDVYCDDDATPFNDGTNLGDDVDEIIVTGTGDLYLVLDDADDDAADWDAIDDGFLIDDLDGTITFEGGAVESGNLNVRITDDEFSFLGTSGDYDDGDIDTIFFNDGEGSDTFDASSAEVEVEVELSQGGYDVVRGGDEDDTVTVSDDANRGVTVHGNGGDDTLVDLDDDACSTFYGEAGNDDIEMAEDSCDTAFPGSGNDDLDGVSVVSYADLTSGITLTENGTDTQTGLAAGDDDFDSAPEVFFATNYGDSLVAGVDGEATLYGLGGNDYVRSFTANKVYGGTGNDTMIGSDGVNYLYGGAGADDLRGRAGRDYLFGGAGRDTVYGGRGLDVCGGEVLNSCEFIG